MKCILKSRSLIMERSVSNNCSCFGLDTSYVMINNLVYLQPNRGIVFKSLFPLRIVCQKRNKN